jgi:hypothetical protein
MVTKLRRRSWNPLPVTAGTTNALPGGGAMETLEVVAVAVSPAWTTPTA